MKEWHEYYEELDEIPEEYIEEQAHEENSEENYKEDLEVPECLLRKPYKGRPFIYTLIV